MKAILFLVLLIACPLGAQTVSISSTSTGRVFQGVGALSAGGSSRLLINYQQPYLGQILDYLFKPNYGANLQVLKVEMGGDENSGVGSEPSFERDCMTPNYTRGYEWFLMQQAAARNSAITFQALPWGAPGCIGANIFTAAMQTYDTTFLAGATSTYGLTFSTVGVWNETACESNNSWIIGLKTALTSASLTTKLVACDETGGNQWNIASDMNGNAPLTAAIDIIGNHYAGNGPSNDPTNYALAAATGKPLYSSEDTGPTMATEWCNTWACAQGIAVTLNNDYILNKQTQVILWSLITSYYSIFTLNNSGLMIAQTPWSGNYSVQPPIWAVAHTTQFAQPGWQYMDAGSVTLTNGGNCVFLRATNNTDYSGICQTQGATGSNSLTVNLGGTLGTGAVHVWKSNSSTQFIQQSDITPSAGAWSATLAADSIYSFTTTTGQAKGSAAPPMSASFPLPYIDTFDSYGAGKTPFYFSDMTGAFDTVSCHSGKTGFCLRQETPAAPIAWPSAATIAPITSIGDPTWTDQTNSTDFLFEAAGTVYVMTRLEAQQQSTGNLYGYGCSITSAGAWVLYASPSVATIASGSTTAPGTNAWHNLSLSSAGSTHTCKLDGSTLGSGSETTYTAGLAGLGMAGFTQAQFKNFQINANPTAATTPTIGGSIAAVTISCPNVGAQNYYTTDGSTPSATSTAYTAPFSVANGTTVKAICTAPGFSNSSAASQVMSTPSVTLGTVTIGSATF